MEVEEMDTKDTLLQIAIPSDEWQNYMSMLYVYGTFRGFAPFLEDPIITYQAFLDD